MTRSFDAMELDLVLQEEVIKPGTTEWAGHIVFDAKKDRSLRISVYYRKLNAVTIGNSNSLSRMDECIDSSGEVTVFSTSNVN